MNFKIIETGKVCEIRLEDDDTGCDCFWDMEQNFPIDHPDRDDDDNIICTQEDYDDLKEYWQDEVDSYKDGTNPNWYNIDDETGEAIESDDVTLYMD